MSINNNPQNLDVDFPPARGTVTASSVAVTSWLNSAIVPDTTRLAQSPEDSHIIMHEIFDVTWEQTTTQNSILIHSILQNNTDIGHVANAVDCIRRDLTCLNAQNNIGWTPLMCAIRLKLELLVEFLVMIGADCELADNIGMTAFFHAAAYGTPCIQKILFNMKTTYPKFFQTDKYGRTLLMHASMYNDLNDEMIIASPIDATDCESQSALMHAIKKNKIENVKKLLDHGANSDESFIYTIVRRDYEMFNLLLSHKSPPNLNYCDAHNKTPLMYAVTHGLPIMIDRLLLMDADFTLCDNKGKTAMDYAAKSQMMIFRVVLKNNPVFQTTKIEATSEYRNVDNNGTVYPTLQLTYIKAICSKLEGSAFPECILYDFAEKKVPIQIWNKKKSVWDSDCLHLRNNQLVEIPVDCLFRHPNKSQCLRYADGSKLVYHVLPVGMDLNTRRTTEEEYVRFCPGNKLASKNDCMTQINIDPTLFETVNVEQQKEYELFDLYD